MKTKLFLVSIFVIVFFVNGYPQTDTNIIFHDFIPDTVLSNKYDTIKIDIDQNSIFDVAFYLYYTSGGDWAYVKSINNNSYYLYLCTSPDTLSSNSLNWMQLYFYWNISICPDRIGVKITDGTNNYYGWIKGTTGYTGGHKTIILDKYAFCKIPNYPFLWGQTEIATQVPEEKMNDEGAVTISQGKDLILINSKNIIKKVTITGIAGTEVVTRTSINSKTAEIDLGNISHGAYIVRVEHKDGSVFTKQIVR